MPNRLGNSYFIVDDEKKFILLVFYFKMFNKTKKSELAYLIFKLSDKEKRLFKDINFIVQIFFFSF